jgi:pyridoxal/pyridoxine/pyridoxamine kinase
MSTDAHNHAYVTSMEAQEEGADEDEAATEQAAQLKKLAEKVDAFVEGEGDLSGAMFEE